MRSQCFVAKRCTARGSHHCRQDGLASTICGGRRMPVTFVVSIPRVTEPGSVSVFECPTRRRLDFISEAYDKVQVCSKLLRLHRSGGAVSRDGYSFQEGRGPTEVGMSMVCCFRPPPTYLPTEGQHRPVGGDRGAE
jgi:hypothetical protein